MRYLGHMAALSHQIKIIVAAGFLSVGISLPGQAQQAPVEDLLDQLQTAEPGEDSRILRQIVDAWSKSGSPAVDLLLDRGKDAMAAGTPEIAVEHFTAAIDHAPGFAEAYHGRAGAYYELGLIGPALDDLREVLVLNPQHFLAMQGFAVVLQELGRPDDALELLRRVQRMHPADADTRSLIDRLELDLEGQAI